MIKGINKILLLLFAVLQTQIAFSQISADDVLNPKEIGLTNWVSNQDNILSPQTVEELNNAINQLYDSTSAQIAVVVIKGDKYTSARELSMELFDKWKVGQKDISNGLIILVVLESRDCFLRTGYGLEGCLTDAYTTRIFNEEMKPCFRKLEWDKGVTKGCFRCIESIYTEYNRNGNSLQKNPNAEKEEFRKFILGCIAIYLVIGLGFFVFILISLPKSSAHINSNYKIEKYNAYKRSYNVLIPFSIIFVWWLLPIIKRIYTTHQNKTRKTQTICTCGHKMRLLSEQEEDKYLNSKAQLEENLGSRDYDVWVCDNCNNIVIYPYDIHDKYQVCSICGAKAEIKTDESIVRYATTYRNGTLRKTYTCKHCKHTRHEDSIIPRKPAVVAFPTGRSSGGFGGGFSGGSFGGGFSGGGGGGGSW